MRVSTALMTAGVAVILLSGRREWGNPRQRKRP